MTATTPGLSECSPGCWVLVWRPSPRLAGALWTTILWLDILVRGRRWLLSAAIVGVVPLLIGYQFRFWPSQLVVGVLLTALVIPTVVGDRFFRAVGIVAVTLGTHSIVAIALSATDPIDTAEALRGSAEYWQETRRWIQLGEDREYTSGVWLPTHLALLLAVPFTAYTSFGMLPLARGIQEVDLMNYYVGQLIRVSERPELAILLGWHPWSFVRGLAYTILVYEMMSWSVERFTGRKLSTGRRRAIRLFAGVILAILDGVVKFTTAPIIREALFANLKPDA